MRVVLTWRSETRGAFAHPARMTDTTTTSAGTPMTISVMTQIMVSENNLINTFYY